MRLALDGNRMASFSVVEIGCFARDRASEYGRGGPGAENVVVSTRASNSPVLSGDETMLAVSLRSDAKCMASEVGRVLPITDR